MTAFLVQLEEIAADVGRLRRRAESETSIAYALERIAGRVQTLDAMICCSAGELVAAGEPVESAIAIVDRRARAMQALLGEKPR